MKYLAIKNWRQFQHYTDRRPPWIKCYISLLDDFDYLAMSDGAQAGIIRLWLLAARAGHPLPNEPKLLDRLASVKKKHLNELIAGGWIFETEEQEKPAEWAPRHVSQDLRAEILKRDDSVCRMCGATETLEIDHIIPISRGGTTDPANLQVLCRRCNRKKRTKLPDETHSKTSSGLASGLTRSSNGPASRADARSREGEREVEVDSPPPAAHAPDVRLAIHLIDPESQAAADAYATEHRDPAALRQALRKLAVPITGNGFGWRVVGQALVEMRANGKEWSTALCAGYCKRIARGPMPDAIPIHAARRGSTRQAQNLAAIAEGLAILEAQEAASNGNF